MAQADHVILEIAEREVRLSNPDKVYFPKPGWTKRDLVDYYLAVADAALAHLRDRPTVMKRFVKGIEEDPIWQKRVPRTRPIGSRPPRCPFPAAARRRSCVPTTPPTSPGR
jgi:hypothetical protein